MWPFREFCLRIVQLGALSATLASIPSGAAELTPGRIEHAQQEPQNWLTFFGSYQAWGYSRLTQINRRNVSQLAASWTFSTGEKGLASAPLVIDGTMFLLSTQGKIYALDAATGRIEWTHAPDMEATAVPPRAALGLAAGFGMIFYVTAANHLMAIDSASGREVWDVQIEDPVQCACGPGWAPLLVKDKVIVGQTSEAAHRGQISAFNAKTGRLEWRFWTVPGPGEPGHETWPEELWRAGGGSSWYVGAYDAELNLMYWGIGNPAPMLAGAYPGDKLYTQSLVALDADTGKVKWHFQETPNDKFDFDSVLEPVLVDIDVGGKRRKLVIHSTKGGFAYVLDRVTGAFVRAFAYSDSINWTPGIGADGKPLHPLLQLPQGKETLVCPGVFGSRAGGHSAYSPRTGWWYTTSYEACTSYRPIDVSGPVEGRAFSAASFGETRAMPGKAPYIAAFDPLTGERKWTDPTVGPNLSSLLATAGDLIFGGDVLGDVWALDATNGAKLWSFNAGSGVSGIPISYSIKDRQYVAIGVGPNAYGLVLAMNMLSPEQKAKMPPVGATLFVFALPPRLQGRTP
jgi:alcohol dehydrogenase (cytochrome c)